MTEPTNKTERFEQLLSEAQEAGLSARQAAFVREYLVDANGTQAAIRAGYSASTANEQASRLLAKNNIRELVAHGSQAQAERVRWDADRVVQELEFMANLDPAVYADVHSLKDLAALPEEYRRAVVGWKWDRTGHFVLTLAKEAALQMLGRKHKLFTDVLEVRDETGLATKMQKARKRAASRSDKRNTDE